MVLYNSPPPGVQRRPRRVPGLSLQVFLPGDAVAQLFYRTRVRSQDNCSPQGISCSRGGEQEHAKAFGVISLSEGGYAILRSKTPFGRP